MSPDDVPSTQLAQLAGATEDELAAALRDAWRADRPDARRRLVRRCLDTARQVLGGDHDARAQRALDLRFREGLSRQEIALRVGATVEHVDAWILQGIRAAGGRADDSNSDDPETPDRGADP